MRRSEVVLLPLFRALLSTDNTERRRSEDAWNSLKASEPDQLAAMLCEALTWEGEPEAEGFRAIAAVLIRTLFGVRSDFWFRLQPGSRAGMKHALVARLPAEPVSHIRRKLTHAIGQVASTAARGEQGWPEILELATRLCNPAQPDLELRQTGLDLVEKIAEYSYNMLAPHADSLLPLLAHYLRAESTSSAALHSLHSLHSPPQETAQTFGVRCAALKAACSMFQELFRDEEGGRSKNPPAAAAQAASEMAPEMFAVAVALLQSGGEGAGQEALAALTSLAEHYSTMFMKSVDVIFSAVISLAASEQLEDSTRQMALGFLATLFEQQAPAMRRHGAALISAVISLLLELLTQQDDAQAPSSPPLGQPTGGDGGRLWAALEDEDEEDEESAEMETLAAAAGVTLDRMSVALGGRAVLSTALPLINSMCRSPDWRRRQAGVAALGIMGEGCADELRRKLDAAVPTIVAFTRDPHARVRYEALKCLGHMTDDFPEAEEEGDDGYGSSESFQERFHAIVLPALVEALAVDGVNAQMPRLQALAASTVGRFCQPEHCLREHLPPEVARALLAALYALARSTTALSVKEECLAAVANAASVIGRDFAVYYSDFLPLVMNVLAAADAAAAPPTSNGHTSPAMVLSARAARLRGNALEALGIMGCSVGRRRFAADARNVMQLLIKNLDAWLQPGDPGAPMVLTACARIGSVLRRDFVPYLRAVVPALLRAAGADTAAQLVDSDYGLGLALGAAANGEVAGNGHAVNGDGSSGSGSGVERYEYNVRGVGKQVVTVNTAATLEKEMALRALHEFCSSMGRAFAPFAAEVVVAVLPRNLAPTNTPGIKAISCGLVAKVLGLAITPSTSPNAAAAQPPLSLGQRQNMLDMAVLTLAQMVRREGLLYEHSLETLCVAADALSQCLRAAYESKGAVSVHATAENEIVRTLRDAGVESVKRSKRRREPLQSRPEEGDDEQGGSSNGLEDDEEKEEEEWEDDLLTSVTDGIGWLIKARKAAILPLLHQEMFPWVWHLTSGGAETESELLLGMCMSIDVLEHCGPAAAPLAVQLVPILLQHGGHDSSASVRQGAVYGLGAAAEKAWPHFRPFLEQAVTLVSVVACAPAQGNDEKAARENAASALVKMSIAMADNSAAEDVEQERAARLMRIALQVLPLTVDMQEAQDCHARVVSLASRGHRLLEGENTAPLLAALCNMMRYRGAADDDDGGGGSGSGGGGGSASPDQDEGDDLDDMWERQLVRRETRLELEKLLTKVEVRRPAEFRAAFGKLVWDQQRAVRMSTEELERGLLERPADG